jgi:hydrogenase maturation factor HypE
MSTGSAEVIAVASIIIYDIYQVKANVYLFLDLENLGVGVGWGGAGVRGGGRYWFHVLCSTVKKREKRVYETKKILFKLRR